MMDLLSWLDSFYHKGHKVKNTEITKFFVCALCDAFVSFVVKTMFDKAFDILS